MSGPIVMPFMKKIQIPRNGLVAEYLANNNFDDTSGNEYNGINIGDSVTFGTDRKSSLNSAFVLNNTDARIGIDATLADLSTTTKGTWSVWVKPIDGIPASNNTIISFGDTDAGTRVQLTLRFDGKIQIFGQLTGANQLSILTDDALLSDNTWAHIAITQNGILPVLYVGGVAVDQSNPIFVDNSFWLDAAGLDNGRLGSLNFNNFGDDSLLNGSIDDTRIYDRVLTSEEITILANE